MKGVIRAALLLFCFCLAGVAIADEALVEREITAEERDHWAYHPLANAEIPRVIEARRNHHPIDAFIKSRLEEEGLETLPAASRSTLLRRVTFDLTGLPPTPDELASFLADQRDDAYERVVDRLLDSTAYGERWAQHWLDLARFAETDGFEHDLVRPNAWRYRDWVIDALNQDVPFDDFVQLQIAGDLLRPRDAQAKIATGFLLCGPDMPDINLQEERRHFVLNEMTATVGAVFLGLQFGCAQCHDHKYDPITHHDFYELRAFFEAMQIFQDHPIPTPAEVAARKDAEKTLTVDLKAKEARHKELLALGKERLREKNPDAKPTEDLVVSELTDRERHELESLKKELNETPKLPPYSRGRVVQEGDTKQAYLFVRGDFRQPGPRVKSDTPSVLDNIAIEIGNENPRVALVRWLTRPDHPLVTRVIVNRLWQWHFGRGLVASASDFGVMGHQPTHPELLDWLARYFVEEGWSFKRMHRLLVTSETYKIASAPYDAGWTDELTQEAKRIWDQSKELDPENELWWRAVRRRLTGEEIRDAMLATTERLSSRRGGEGVRPPLPAEVTRTLLKDHWPVTKDPEDWRRRSIYLFVRRNLRYPFFDVFDRPDTNASCPQRHESTTAPQSLTLLNSKFSLDSAYDLAGLLIRRHSGAPEGQIEEAYIRILSRKPNGEELSSATRFLRQQAEHAKAKKSMARSQMAMADFCLALLNSSEFIYLD